MQAMSSWWELHTAPPREKLQPVIPKNGAQGVRVPSTHFTGSSVVGAEANAVELAEGVGFF